MGAWLNLRGQSCVFRPPHRLCWSKCLMEHTGNCCADIFWSFCTVTCTDVIVFQPSKVEVSRHCPLVVAAFVQRPKVLQAERVAVRAQSAQSQSKSAFGKC